MIVSLGSGLMAVRMGKGMVFTNGTSLRFDLGRGIERPLHVAGNGKGLVRTLARDFVGNKVGSVRGEPVRRLRRAVGRCLAFRCRHGNVTARPGGHSFLSRLGGCTETFQGGQGRDRWPVIGVLWGSLSGMLLRS